MLKIMLIQYGGKEAALLVFKGCEEMQTHIVKADLQEKVISQRRKREKMGQT